MLPSWAEDLLHASWSPDVIDLHVKDTLAAFVAGTETREGKALAALYGPRADRSELAAAASAIARLSECDDIHLASCVTPGSVVIPVALAFAGKAGEQDFNRAVAAGYAAGIRLGIGIGGANALSGGVWPTLLAAPLMGAVTASCLSGHDTDQLAHAMALALSGASGRLGRPAGMPSGRWFALAEAVSKGIRASVAAGHGFRGDLTLPSEPWLTAQAGHDKIDWAAFESPTRTASIADVGYKPFPIARQGASAVTAFQRLLSHGLDSRRIDTIEVFVPAMNVALLSRPVAEGDRLSRLSNMGYQLACAALAPDMLYDVERRERPDVPLMEFARRVSVISAADMDAHLPNRWPARVVVNAGPDRLEERVMEMLFDHDASDIAQKLNDKWRRLLPEDAGDFFDDAAPRSASKRHAVLWQIIERHVSMAAQSRHEPKPAQG
jgi:2-methylcitrate dehydratase PrpD